MITLKPGDVLEDVATGARALVGDDGDVAWQGGGWNFLDEVQDDLESGTVIVLQVAA